MPTRFAGLGGLDIVVNSAARQISATSIHDVSGAGSVGLPESDGRGVGGGGEPGMFFTTGDRQGFVARLTNDAYADTRAAHPTRFRCFASRPMVSPDEALKELDRAINT